MSVEYELVYDCGDTEVATAVRHRLAQTVGPACRVQPTEDGPAWAVTVRFPSRDEADRFFDGDAYRGLCDDVRRRCRSAVLVVPLGEV